MTSDNQDKYVTRFFLHDQEDFNRLAGTRYVGGDGPDCVPVGGPRKHLPLRGEVGQQVGVGPDDHLDNGHRR